MKFHILAIGRLKTGPEKEMAEDYLTRARALGRKAGVAAIELAEGAESGKAAEAAWLAAKAPPGAFRVALDEGGKSLTSEQFAGVLRKAIDGGIPHIAFFIGGPDGHGEALLSKVDLRLSLGALTWPHRLARIMLAEQIYRAVTIMVNHPYHRP